MAEAGEQKYQHPTVNTFTRKPAWAQLLSYFVFTAQVVTFYVCLIPEVSDQQTALITMHTVYPVSLAVLIFVTLASSIIDPTDPVVVDCRRHRFLNSTSPVT